MMGGNVVPIPTDYVAYYPFNGNADDESGNGNNGIVTDATLTTDRHSQSNKAYDFDGITSEIRVPDAPELDMGVGSFTICFWVQTSQVTSDGRIIDKRGTGADIGYTSLLNGGGFIELSAFSGNEARDGTLGIVNDGSWHFVVHEYDTLAQQMYTRLDGGLRSLGTYIGDVGSLDNAKDLYIGRRLTGGRYFDGKIDDIGIYKRILTSAEIQALYNE
jgi:hypothetical protein